MIDNYRIGNQSSFIRKEKGLTGEKFAEQLGVSPEKERSALTRLDVCHPNITQIRQGTAVKRTAISHTVIIFASGAPL